MLIVCVKYCCWQFLRKVWSSLIWFWISSINLWRFLINRCTESRLCIICSRCAVTNSFNIFAATKRIKTYSIKSFFFSQINNSRSFSGETGLKYKFQAAQLPRHSWQKFIKYVFMSAKIYEQKKTYFLSLFKLFQLHTPLIW